jgi:acyl transferase domain-containing protein
VGAVLLKPLDDALRDGDQIYAVIKSTAVNHGKTNGYSVPIRMPMAISSWKRSGKRTSIRER